MRIIGTMVVGNGEAGRYLRASLDELGRLCDGAVIALNGADAETRRMVEDSGFSHYDDDREWGLYQPRIKEDLARMAGKLVPDWIVSIDADETFGPTVDRAALEELAGNSRTAWYFYVIDLWDDGSHMRQELSFWNVRFWRYAPEYGLLFENKPLHCGLAPAWAYHYGSYAPHALMHSGLIRREDREAKSRRYAKYDANRKLMPGNYYDILLSDRPPEKLDLGWLTEKLRNYAPIRKSEREPKNESMPMEYAMVKKDNGQVVDIPVKHLPETLRRHPRWKLLKGDEDQPPIVDEEPAEIAVPDVTMIPEDEPIIRCACGFTAKSDLGLRRHRTRLGHV